MLSVIIPARAGREHTLCCIQSVFSTFHAYPDTVEYILLDDHSDPQFEIQAIFQGFRASVGAEVRIFRSRRQVHYTAGLAFGLSLTQGDLVLFLSNDTIVTRDYVDTTIRVAHQDPGIGTVRGTAQRVDIHPEHRCAPPLPLRDYRDVALFSHFVAQYFGDSRVEDRFLCGDAFLVKRAVIDQIGVPDTRYFGYFGDLDFGLRAQRAGFKLACAKGAWLSHAGAVSLMWETPQPRQEFEPAYADRMAIVQAAYAQFREKWDPHLPERYPGVAGLDIEKLWTIPIGFSLYQRPDESLAAEYDSL